MKKFLPVKISLLCALSLLFVAFIPKADDPIDKLVAALQRWTDKYPQEKVYLHMDKPYYALGDTIWFKGYVTVGSRHQLSALSQALYVDLVTEKDSIIRSLKLPVTSGMVIGDFILDDDMEEGSYRVRAYTRWMRNAGEEYFFDRTITIGSIVNYNINARADYAYKTVNDKQQLVATLTYTDDAGKPLANQDVDYQIYVNKKVVWTKSAKTDANGNLLVNIANSDKVDLRGAYIKTVIANADKQKINKDFPIKANLAQSDVQFFPESGNLVNGVTSRVGFKAVGIDGAGIAIKGNIMDNEGKDIGAIETLFAGMGSFSIHPEAGKTYSAKITFADGMTKRIALPKAIDDGYVLSVYQPNKDSLLVRINAGVKLAQTAPVVSLIAQTRGETIVATTVKIEKPITSIWLAKKDFPGGIAQFTLFNSNNEPLNERIAFIKSNDQLALTLNTAKTTYNSKEQVQILLNAKNSKGQPTFGNFSVSVINETKVPSNESLESTIFSNLLLTSDLQGYIEKPNYYFTKAEGTDKALDNLMLTQGYRRFTWKDVANPSATKPAFEAEGLGTTISGRVLTLGSKPMPGADVMLMAVKANVMLKTKADSLGRFRFDKIFATDSINFAVQARTAKNTDKAIIIIDTIPKIKLAKNRNIADVSTNITGTLKAYIDNGKKQDELYEKLGMLDKVQRLREVRINAKRNGSTVNIAPQGMYRINSESADRTLIVRQEEAEKFPSLAMYLQSVLPSVRVETGVNASVNDVRGSRMQIILNGRKLMTSEEESEILDGGVQPEDVVKVDIVHTNLAMIGLLGGQSIMIYTKNVYMRKQNNLNIANVKPKGFNKVREFYLPKYNKPGSDLLPDLRTTVYWNPYLKTDANGQTSFNYFNADGPGTYKVIVEGINADGELGRQVYKYTVEASPITAFAPQQGNKDATVKAITTSLDTLRKRLPIEKVYLHTDKPYYNIGDTLWFKSYLVNGANLTPSGLSKLLYVEIADDTSSVVRRVSVPVKDGVGWGQIPLPKEIFKEGGVTLRAYTNWMRNFGEDYVFKQRLYLGVPAANAWLVNSTAIVKRVDDKDQLEVNLKLNRSDKSPVSMHNVEVKIYEDTYRPGQSEVRHYIYNEKMLTGIDGSLKLTNILKEKTDGRRMRVEIRPLEDVDGDHIVQVPININRLQNIDVQFLPEGGKLVAGLASTIGFKAINEDGKGAPVMGEICDSKGIKVADFASAYNGMGSFTFTPKAGETYSVKIIQPTTKVFDLPKVNNEGTVMHITNAEDGDNLTVLLTGAGNALVIDSAYYLVGSSRGAVYYAEKVNLNQPEVNVSKKLFPSGVARFTLFRGKRPLNERMVFIDQKDRLDINVIPNKAAHLKRDSIGLEIEVKDKTGMPVKGSFSLAVTDDSQVKPDSLGNNSIAASLLINSDLKGNIETPGYYVNRKDKEAWTALDNLMLTQGWTSYDWEKAFNPPTKPAAYEVEKDFKITGLVTNLTNKPIPNAEVMLSSQKPSFITTVAADANGRYVFNKLPTIDSGSFFLQANNKKGKSISFGNISVDKVSFPAVPLALKDQIMPWYVNPDSTQINYIKRKAEKADDANLKLDGKILREVAIKGKKIIPGGMNPYGPGNSDIAFDEKQIKASGVLNLYELLKQKVPGFRVGWYHYLNKTRPIPIMNTYGLIITIDGAHIESAMQLDTFYSVTEYIDEMSQFKIATLKGLEIVYSRPYANRTVGKLGPLKAGEWAEVIITTASGKGWYRNRAPGVTTYRPLPVLQPQAFYNPRYGVKPSTTGEPDYRATVYWEPNITTDANGKAKASFYSTDIKSSYTIKVVGVDESGGIGDGSLKIKAQ